MVRQRRLLFIAFVLGFIFCSHTQAEIDWVSVTLDNDLFIGNDNGYTNGIYFSSYDVGRRNTKDLPKADFWVHPIKWTMARTNIQSAANAYTLGQTMNTPSDITIANPDENELPYSAMLSVTNSYLVITPAFADRATTMLGMIGPSARGEEAQSFVHNLIDSPEPQGWDTQLGDELVVMFSRARTWRTWASKRDRVDLLTSADLSIGTIRTSLSAGATLRYGRHLSSSYATTLFNSARTANPSAIDGGWFFYAGIQGGYMAQQIYADGNTFRDSRSIDYDPGFIAASAGFSYSFRQLSVSLALADLNLLQSGVENESLNNLTQFGTVTVAWRR